MPAVPAALAEIEDRLAEIRYRLNRRTLVSVLCPIVAALLVVAALITWSAARGTAESFAIALWAGGAAAAIVLAWGALSLANRWLSLAEVARLADERAGLRERLSTVHWLARAGNPSPLAPVLIVDTFEQRARWQASAIVPRRFPWEIGAPLAALALLGAALFLDEPLLPSLEELLKNQPRTEHQMEMAVPFPPPPPTPMDTAQASLDGEPLLEAASEGEGDAGALGLEPGEGAGRAATSAALTEQVRDAIRKALQRFEEGEGKRDLAKALPGSDADLTRGDLPPQPGAFDLASSRQAGARKAGTEPRPSAAAEKAAAAAGAEAEAKKRGRDASASVDPETGLPRGQNDRPKDDRRAVAAEPYEPRPEDGDVAAMPGTGDAPETQYGAGGEGREQDRPADEARVPGTSDPRARAKPGDAAVAGDLRGEGKQKGGASASAGAGSEGEGGLFAKAGGEGSKPLAGAPKGTFKLTLGSFLTAGPGAKDKGERRERVAANPRAAVNEPPALHPNQSDDDALRRADIPPEYEDVVRRIYSSRPAR